MTEITHHLPDWLVRSYATGSLGHAFSLVVAAHVSQCDECRARLEAEELAGGLVLDELEGMAPSDDLRRRVFDGLDDDDVIVAAQPARAGIYPGAVVEAMGADNPRWRALGGGIKQAILSEDKEGSARLLYIPPGMAVPDHTHGGLELTMVLQGSFSDETGRFGVGDVEVADDDLDHTPIAGMEDVCICLAATDAPLKFKGLLPRLLQPIFRI
ncbi:MULTISPECIES: ChrR family anti-sigma-E factor [Thioclava]|uniref:Transcriptional regulator n=1 Tax=Thioclava nitratireducens TaxID=1915078 RepID=A0ABM6ID96_9RHOB|nr:MULTISPECIES: ChrR family anti-sigma-E factor [Thioclava]AQS46677.1 transcriptional regulator [Thioclava nitratireducens]OWY02175.1 transcriptional regulator [Thioclava sp. IC9]OWY02726.1 transcriptional regulator [Thioclava sp. F1Mire-8]OWY07621.1 transcriptional regulator [Thioclava sp. F42-5]OWY13183.1 transcriptional regulator [Thioclava sp. F34-6]